jgi:hypothetical protein
MGWGGEGSGRASASGFSFSSSPTGYDKGINLCLDLLGLPRERQSRYHLGRFCKEKRKKEEEAWARVCMAKIQIQI